MASIMVSCSSYQTSILQPYLAATTPPAATSSGAATADQDAPNTTKKPAKKLTREQEIDRSIDRGTVPARYRSRVPKEYQQYVPFEKQWSARGITAKQLTLP